MELNFVSRAGEKLQHAFDQFSLSVEGKVCADFGCSTGGFTDCMLQHGASKVYSVDTGYGVLDWKLRNDDRVVVLERENAMHIKLAEQVDFVSVDTSWTKLSRVLPNVKVNLKAGGEVVALIKPHYEAPQQWIVKGLLLDEKVDEVIEAVKLDIVNCGFTVVDVIESPIKGKKGGNREFLAHLKVQ